MPLIMAFAIGSTALAGYSSTELCLIPWGNGENQLKIGEPHYEYDIVDTLGTIDSALWETGGPSDKFVDRYENIYISSYEYKYFKIFNNSGVLISDLSINSPKYDTSFYAGAISNFYVDSLMQIYIQSFPERTYITVIDTSGTIIDRLTPPCGFDTFMVNTNPNYMQEEIGGFRFGSNDVLTIGCITSGIYTYHNGQFFEGGAYSWRAKDSSYYVVSMQDSSTICFKKYGNPDKTGKPGWIEDKCIPFDGRLETADLSAVDDSLRIYAGFYDAARREGGILAYDANYALLDKIIMPACWNRFMICLSEFIRRDGTIYEFRCLDDGLHVIKWTKQ